MKHYDKLLFAVALIACLSGVVLWIGLSPSPKKIAPKAVAPQGETILAWKNSNERKPIAKDWKAPEWDIVEGWNYDLFSVPEITFVSKEKKYIARELPPPAAEKIGIRLISIKNPPLRFKITSCASDVPPTLAKDEKDKSVPGKYRLIVTLENTHTGKSQSVNFMRVAGTKLKRQKLDNGTQIFTLTPKKPIEIPEQNALLKNIVLVSGRSDSGDGTIYTRRFATIIDRADPKDPEIKITEETLYDRNRTEALFQEEDSPRQWLYAITEIAGADAPAIEILTRDSAAGTFTRVEGGDTFKIENAIYAVKELDISTQEAIIAKQSESTKKSKHNKVWQWTLTPKK